MSRRQAALRPSPANAVRRHRFGAGTIALGISLALLFGWGVNIALEPEMMPLRVIRLQGELRHVSPERLKGVIAPFAEQGFLRLDVDRMRSALEAMPWVNAVSVRRSWPDVLEVRIDERQALARWNDELLVDNHGTLFASERAEWPADLPELRGPEGNVELLAGRFRQAKVLLEPLGLRVKGVDMTERRAWRIRLDEGQDIVLGRRDYEERLLRFARVYPAALANQRSRFAQVDMRYMNGFAVSWREAKAGV